MQCKNENINVHKNNLELWIPIKPVPKQSFQYTQKGLRYTKASTKAYINHVKLYLLSIMPKGFQKFKNGIHIDYTFVFQLPVKMKKQAHLKLYKTSRPDADNLQKTINDILNGLVFEDDSQICSGTFEKIYGEVAGTSLNIYEI